MASLRKIRRRVKTWRDYEGRAYGPGPGVRHRGRERAILALVDEKARRYMLGWDRGDFTVHLREQR